MAEPFLRGFSGLSMRRVRGVAVPVVGSKRLKVDREAISGLEVVQENREVSEALKEYPDRGIRQKGIITGPYTISSHIPPFSLGYYANRKNGFRLLLDDHKRLVLEIANHQAGAGATDVQLDEPPFSRGMPPDYAFEVLGELATEIRRATGVDVWLHICGPISTELYRRVLAMDGITYLNFDFAAYPENLRNIKPELWNAPDKYLVGGVTSSKVERDNPEEMERLVRTLIERFGDRLKWISHGCGLGKFSAQIASAKNRDLGQLLIAA
jgi:methionine synthase II (cobalamin-independent)